MTDFNDRERAEESKFARDEEMHFRIQARRNRLLGQWAAEQMGLSSVEADSYAKAVVQADFETVARQLSALGFFVESLQSSPDTNYSEFIRGMEIRPSKMEKAKTEAVEAAAGGAVSQVPPAAVAPAGKSSTTSPCNWSWTA